MLGDYLPDDLKILWKELSTSPLQLSPDRAELESQRDFHWGKWFWSRLLILLPGQAGLLSHFHFAKPRGHCDTSCYCRPFEHQVGSQVSTPNRCTERGSDR
jgi:hypothetical protein